MWLKLFLDEESFNCLCESVPRESNCGIALNRAVPLGTSRVVDCDDTEAFALLLQDQILCPNAVSEITEAIHIAGLRIGIASPGVQEEGPMPSRRSLRRRSIPKRR